MWLPPVYLAPPAHNSSAAELQRVRGAIGAEAEISRWPGLRSDGAPLVVSLPAPRRVGARLGVSWVARELPGWLELRRGARRTTPPCIRPAEAGRGRRSGLL